MVAVSKTGVNPAASLFREAGVSCGSHLASFQLAQAECLLQNGSKQNA